MTPDEIIQLSEILKSSNSTGDNNSLELLYSLIAIIASNGALFLIAGKRIMSRIVDKVVKTAVDSQMLSVKKLLDDNEELTRDRFKLHIEEFRFLHKYNDGTEEKIEDIKEKINKIEKKVK